MGAGDLEQPVAEPSRRHAVVAVVVGEVVEHALRFVEVGGVGGLGELPCAHVLGDRVAARLDVASRSSLPM